MMRAPVGRHPRVLSAGIHALVLLILLASSSAHAFVIHGTIENGTTGSKDVKATVVAVSPSEGMEEVATVQATGGHFELKIEGAGGMYLIRAEYAGVEYSTPVQATGGDQDVAITVYDTTNSWEGVHIVIPHLAASRQGDHLHIEQMYEITNETSPPKAIVDKGGAFHVYLPAEMDTLTNSFVSSLGVPIERDPEPTDVPGIYQIDYPIRPGETRIGFSYTVPYASGTYTLHQKFLHDIQHLSLFAVDPAMKISSSSHTFEKEEAVHGMTSYTLHNVPANTELVLMFQGGDPNFAGIHVDGQTGQATDQPQGEDQGGGNVTVVKGAEEQMSIFLMITVLLVLAGVIGMALRDQHDPLNDPKVLRAHYATLVSRLARLDDLHAAEAIPGDAYRATREDLMGRLSALAMHMRTHGGLHKPHGEQEPTKKSKAR
jgi:hypothetical protein